MPHADTDNWRRESEEVEGIADILHNETYVSVMTDKGSVNGNARGVGSYSDDDWAGYIGHVSQVLIMRSNESVMPVYVVYGDGGGIVGCTLTPNKDFKRRTCPTDIHPGYQLESAAVWPDPLAIDW